MSKEEMRIEAVKIANTGRKQTPEHIQKRTASRMKTNPTPTLGKKLGPSSEERKQKIGDALRASQTVIWVEKEAKRLKKK